MKKDKFNILKANIQKDIEDKKYILKCLEMLEDLWCDVGPYNREPITQKTLYKLQDLFEFDDSE
jgi:hypothetical protein